MNKPGFAAVLLALATGFAHAEVPRDFLGQYEAEAKKTNAAFTASAQRGEKFFKTVQGKDWSCATCHTDNPAVVGKHATTSKPIEALAPAANPERFARADKVEKWFKRNCNDVLGRACTAAEKGDVLAWLMTVKK